MPAFDVKRLSQMLIKARYTVTPVDVKHRHDFSMEQAYAVQTQIRQDMEEKGHRVVGCKIGLTSRAMQKMFNIDRPDYGYLFADQVFAQGGLLKARDFITPRVEGEIAFLLKSDLRGPGATAYDVLKATAGVMACVEIVDSRWGFEMNVLDSIADNASCGGFLLGSKMLELTGLDLRYLAMFILKNGELVNSGAGVEVMGDPLNAVVWLVNQLSGHGSYLKAGDIVLSGALTAAVPVADGDAVSVCFSKLGTVDLRFV